MPENDLQAKMDERIKYERAPWVPVKIEVGKEDEAKLGIPSLMGSQPRAVKLGYSFVLTFQPAGEYPFLGWQAWIQGEDLKSSAAWAHWTKTGSAGENLVKFVPKNLEGTEVEIFVYQMPPAGKELSIGPIGANSGELSVQPNSSSLGSIFPARLSGIKPGFPFTMSFQPSASFPILRGWQLRSGDGEDSFQYSSWTFTEEGGTSLDSAGWEVKWEPRNADGTEIRITIIKLPDNIGTITVMPLNGENKRANIQVAVPEGWGTVNVAVAPEDRRIGFPFTVEFTPSSTSNFIKWLAFKSKGLDDIKDLTFDQAKAVSFKGEGIIISDPVMTQTGSLLSTVTVNIAEQVILVPFCDQRPRVIQSNPPLFNTGFSYSLGQTITIFFSEPGLNYASGTLYGFFKEGYIRISGQTIDGSKTYPDLKGYFNNPVYDENTQSITIWSNSNKPLPLEELIITVTVGPNIEGKIGSKNTMGAPVSFSYRTNAEIVRDIYTAENIWAIHEPESAVKKDNFFNVKGAISGSGNNYLDARLRKTSGKYKVTLYFSITSNSERLDKLDPTHCIVQEYRAYTLAGNNGTYEGGSKTHSIEPITTDSAGLIYKGLNSNVRTFKIEHEIQTDTPPAGIWRLVLTPYRNENGQQIGLDAWGNANVKDSYAAVVLNDTLPAGNVILTLRNAELSGTGVYGYGEGNPYLGFDVNFNNAIDNWTSNGILRDHAIFEKPWTIDNFDNLEWRWQITSSTGTAVSTPSGWLPTSTNSVDLAESLSTHIGPSPDIRKIQILYRDKKLGEAAAWLNTNSQFIYNNAVYGDVIDYSAEYNPVTNTIEVKWKNPAETDFDHVEVWYRLNDGYPVTALGFEPYARSRGETFKIYNVTPIDTSGVRDDRGISNADCYEIFMRTHSANDSKAAKSFKIWNFGTPGDSASGMKTGTATGYTEAIEVIDAAGLSGIAQSLGAQYVLANSFEVSGHSPIGTASEPFTGKFYGNDYKITVSGFANPTAETPYAGLFGYTDGAEIRDLVFEYNATTAITTPGSGGVYLGGIAAYASATNIRNCITAGKSNRSITVAPSGSASVRLGGIAGYFTGAGKIENCRTTLSVVCNGGSSGDYFIGGLVGQYGSGGTGTDFQITISNGIDNPVAKGLMFDGITSTANVTAEKNLDISGLLCIGGIAGSFDNISDTASMRDIYSNGNVSFFRTHGTPLPAVNNDIYNYVGGIIGRLGAQNMENCRYFGEIKSTKSEALISEKTYVGGIVGQSENTTEIKAYINNCRSGADISLTGKLKDWCLGGFIGNIGNRYTITNSSYEKGNITFTGGTDAARADLGGFAGNLFSDGSFVSLVIIANCGVLSTGTITVTGTITTLYVGGFLSSTPGTISDCYSKINVLTKVNASARLCAGGFTGSMNAQGLINRSYSSGDVRAEQAGNSDLYVGGLAGQAGYAAGVGSGTIRNSYNTGDIIAINSSGGAGIVYAGGVAGYMDQGTLSGTGTIENCINLGRVIAQSSSADVYAGGIAGYLGGYINNSASLGSMAVSASKTGTAYAGRINANTGVTTRSNNHAIDNMLVGTGPHTAIDLLNDTTETVINSIRFGTISPGIKGENTLNGADVTNYNRRTSAFWRLPPPGAAPFDASSHGLGFDTDCWLISMASDRGFPFVRAIINNIPGQALLGQADWTIKPGITFALAQNFESGLLSASSYRNGTETNQWCVGNAESYISSYSAYITNDSGTSNNYTNTATSIVHMLVSINAPLNAPLTISFNWKLKGEGAAQDNDILKVYHTYRTISTSGGDPPAYLKINAGQEISDSETGVQLLGTLRQSSGGGTNWDRATFTRIGDSTSESASRSTLIFSWINNGSNGDNPPVAIDNIVVSY